ncbi:hypothetical protein V1639_04125 [Pseudarthrobacter sp. J75]|uniref:hypothetical protein n=1 Tax=unclassified Pseudarthrobacter TaxID=2647000 RepID=UPI002E7FD7E3|nr:MULTISPECIES: hypothetical protein [unclassified Pseudarthrobacter]MEE2522135.1 hypothetical protein [Pseudarthrobacter sp. J47]MEE2528219.1 hypothetical protein [Pseudarthrobacter sp. J75]
MIGHAAQKVGVRVFFIKGPASGEMGLRRPKVSIDVDAFVSPNDMPALLSELSSLGWRTRPSAGELVGFPRHSETLYHDSWPNNIDVHFRFPGMDMPAALCFDLLWAETQEFPMAGQLIRVPTFELGVVITALHALRTPHGLAEQEALRFLRQLPLDRHRSSILRIAQSSNSLAALRPFLVDAFGPAVVSSWPDPSPDWRNLTSVREPGAAWVVALSAAPWQKWPGILYSALIPSKRALLGADLYADVSLKGRFIARVGRWRVFFNRIPFLVQNIGSIWHKGKRP